MNARSGACGTGCRSARRWHARIGAAPIATYLHARFPVLNPNNMVHNALDNIIKGRFSYNTYPIAPWLSTHSYVLAVLHPR
jgi:hypothetical protein